MKFKITKFKGISKFHRNKLKLLFKVESELRHLRNEKDKYQNEYTRKTEHNRKSDNDTLDQLQVIKV